MRKNKIKPTRLVSNIPAYVNWWNEISKYTFIITANGNFYLVNGVRIKANEFESSMPMPVLVKNCINKGPLADGRVIE